MTDTGKNWMMLLVFVAVSLAAGGIGTLLSGDGIQTWYVTLRKPAWNPPSWIFGPVWTALYCMMGVAAWLVWRIPSQQSTSALRLFFIQLVLNALWTGIFFGLHRPGLAFSEIVLLWLAILVTLVAFWRCTPPAGILMLPYLAWVSFATILNYTLWRMNET